MVPRMVKGLKDVKVVGVAAGRGHTVICTDDGRVWTFGDGVYPPIYLRVSMHSDHNQRVKCLYSWILIGP